MKSPRPYYPGTVFASLAVLLAVLLVGCGSNSTLPEDSEEPDRENGARETVPAGTTGFQSDEATARTTDKAMNEEGSLDLISASSRGDEEGVEELLAQGADVSTRGEDGRIPLIAAAYGNHVEVARTLISAGANVNVKDDTQQSAYLISTSEVGDDPRLLELTLANGADVSSLDRFNGTGLIRASERGYVQIVRELLATETNVDHVNNLGWTALLEAIILGDCGTDHTQVVRFLVEAGADVNLPDGDGVTPLQHARQLGCSEIAQILENSGAA